MYGYVKDCDHHELLRHLPNMYTIDNTSWKLRWEVEGHTPIPEPEEKIASLEQENIEKDKKIKELMQLLEISQEAKTLLKKQNKLLEESKVPEQQQAPAKLCFRSSRLTKVVCINTKSHAVFLWPSVKKQAKYMANGVYLSGFMR